MTVFDSSPIRKDFDDALLYTCSKLYPEARLILASSICLELYTSYREPPPAIISFYYPLIQRISVKFGPGPYFKTSVFPGLRELTLRCNVQERINSSQLDRFRTSEPFGQTILRQVLEGDRDEVLKEVCKEVYKGERNLWVEELLADSMRTFRMIISAEAYWLEQTTSGENASVQVVSS